MKKKIILMCLCLLTLLTQIVCAAPSVQVKYKVNSFSYTVAEKTDQQPKALRLEFGLSNATNDFVTNIDPANPNDLTIDFKQSRLGKIKQPVNFDGELAKSIEFAQIDKTTTRVTLHLPKDASTVNYKIYTLPKDSKTKKPFRLVIDLFDRPSFSFTEGLKGKTIIIDPGHGGSDPGAIGPNRLREKEVTLGVSLKVEDILKSAGANVIMTRTDDQDVYGPNASDRDELQARVNVGRENPADVFVSIHANSFTSPSAHGTATYFYEKSPYDRILAQSLQDGLVEFGGLSDRGIQAANFYVVKRTSTPAALVELAFISNPREESLLGSSDFQLSLAEGICKGLSDFFSQASK